jgi:hypothetical protein
MWPTPAPSSGMARSACSNSTQFRQRHRNGGARHRRLQGLLHRRRRRHAGRDRQVRHHPGGRATSRPAAAPSSSSSKARRCRPSKSWQRSEPTADSLHHPSPGSLLLPSMHAPPKSLPRSALPRAARKPRLVWEAGVDVVRLNFSHGTAADHTGTCRDAARGGAHRLGRTVGVMADLQGPKIRIGKFAAKVQIDLKAGQEFIFDIECSSAMRERVGLDYPELVNDVLPAMCCCSTTAAS